MRLWNMLAAALQHAQRNNAPIHVHVLWGIGHSQGMGVASRCATMAMHYGVLTRVLGLHSR